MILNRLRDMGIGMLLGLLIAGAVLMTASYLRKDATTADTVLKGPTEVITAPVAIHPDKTKKALHLPKRIIEDKSIKVIGATTLAECERTVTAVLNTTTGATELLVRTEPSPWFSTDARTSLGVAYGAADGGGAQWQATAGYDFLRVKAARVGLVGTVDERGRWFAGIGVKVTW